MGCNSRTINIRCLALVGSEKVLRVKHSVRQSARTTMEVRQQELLMGHPIIVVIRGTACSESTRVLAVRVTSSPQVKKRQLATRITTIQVGSASS